MRKVTLLFFACLLYVLPSFAQDQVTGKISDNIGLPLAGVSIKNLRTGTGGISSADGSFRINGKNGDELEITMVGFIPQRVKFDGQPIVVTLEQNLSELSQIVLVGTRTAGRVKTQTPVPVDVVNVAQVTMPTARMDITSILNVAAPSFNYNKQSGSDGADHVDLATLRGLGPDQTLVLVNGKRRHQTAFVAVFGTRGRGNSGTDLNAIASGAIDRVEILRDGASAQYGSDAIAGVINLVMKKNVNKITGNIGWAGYHDPKFNTAFAPELYSQYEHDSKIDGNSFNGSINLGLPLGKKGGFINITGEGLSSGKTFRQALKTENYLTDDDAMFIDIYRRGHGDASLDMAGTFINAELPITDNSSFYSFGGYNYKSSDAYAFTRNFSARPDRFPTDQNGNIVFREDIMRVADDGEIWYSPHIQTKIKDYSVTAGFKGTMKSNWAWDLSNSVGKNDFHFYGDKTFNASIGAFYNHFDDGGFNFLQNTANFNMSKAISKQLNLAFGAEYRYENYKIYAGEEASYTNYDPNGIKATGAQGFPGYQPGDEVNASRHVVGVYGDAEYDVTEKWLVNGAVRYEHYNDFGSTTNFKLASRVKATDKLNIRGSVSTGFRAPSLQQINFSSTFTTVQASTIAEVKIAPNYSSLATAAGIPKLKQEKSVNAGLGFAWHPLSALNITVDGYFVRIKDRVVISGQFDGSDPDLDAGLRSQMAALNVSLAQFFANAVTTTNGGVDIVIDYNKKVGKHKYKAVLAGNIQSMKINDINVPDKLSGSEFLRQTFLSDREQKFILASAPKTKFSFNFEYGCGKLTSGARLTYFGKVVLLGYGEDGLGINPMVPLDNGSGSVPDQYNYGGKLVSDIYLSYPLGKSFTLYGGVDNIFNVHPDFGVVKGAKDWAYNNETGGPWDAVQMGGNGRRLFLRVGFTF